MKELEHWSENIIIVDGDYADHVAFDLIVNFERMIGRHIPQADMAHWIDCIALDGGVKEKPENESHVIFVHNKDTKEMKNFLPSNYDNDLNGKAFKDNLGEFVMSSYAVEEVVSKDDFILDILKTASNHEDVRRIMVISDCDDGTMIERLKQALRDADDEKRITIFAMQPIAGGNFRQEILGYSLLSALGIRADEIKAE